jgi:hypothetical protein
MNDKKNILSQKLETSCISIDEEEENEEVQINRNHAFSNPMMGLYSNLNSQQLYAFNTKNALSSQIVNQN